MRVSEGFSFAEAHPSEAFNSEVARDANEADNFDSASAIVRIAMYILPN
jgi:hypothetical protein